MSWVLVILAALGCAEGFGLAEVMSNYAKVTRNTELAARNDTDGFGLNETIHVTTEPANDTEYEDFDDLGETEEALSRQSDSGTVLNYVNGLVSLLALMYKFGDKKPGRVTDRREGYGAFQPRFKPDAATKKFKYEQPHQPENGGYTLMTNGAESYVGKTSYDSDLEMYKTGVSPGDHAQTDGGWNAVSQDYPVYAPEQWKKPEVESWNKPEIEPWKKPEVESWKEAHPYQSKPFDYVDFHDHPDEFHHHHHHQLENHPDEDRVNKRPYSYYFLGRKLWYIPLIFSVYFIIYIAALVLKSVARHKIQFPEKLWELNDQHYKHRMYRRIDDATEDYDKAVVTAKYKFM